MRSSAIRCLGWISLALVTTPAWAQTIDDRLVCEQVGRAAEQAFDLPQGILVAIGKAESAQWPWTANVDGVPEMYRTKADAVAALTKVRVPRPTNMDIGCFQISSRYHPNAFASIEQALDPTANAQYAAHFLAELYLRTGDWRQAVGLYHSATAPLEVAYRDRVLALWKGPAIQPSVDETPRWRVISIGPAVQPAVRVWNLATDVPTNTQLPHVITLRR